MYEHAEYLNSTFSDFSKTSNWGVLEFQGLFNVAVFMSDFKNAEQWKNDALQNLAVCAQLQVLPDGTQWEQSPMYHNEVFHCFMNVNYLAQKMNILLPDVLITQTKAMAWANVKWQKPNFHQPLTGDSDDTDLRGLLTLAADIFDDGGLKSRAFSTSNYENCFLLNTGQQLKYSTMAQQELDFTSAYLQSTGEMIMRSSWDESASYSSLQVKKIGCGHAHDDILNFTLFASGRDYLVDGGRYTYVNSKIREELKSSSSHNLLTVDDLPNSIYENSWNNSFNAVSQGVFTNITPKYDYAEAENLAYQRLADPVLIKRRAIFIKPCLWFLFDSFSANKSHTYALNFNFPDKEIRLDSNTVSTTYAKNNLVIRSLKTVKMKKEDSHWSPEYNLLKENDRVWFSRKATGFDSFITVLNFPDQDKFSCNRIPVYDRKDKIYKDDVVEAVEFTYGSKEFMLMVVHRVNASSAPFFKLKSEIVSGEVVLLEKKGDKYKQFILKD